MTRAFFVVDVLPLGDQKQNGLWLIQRIFRGKKRAQSHHILGETKTEFAIFRP
jgi:hypothetical protein